MFFGWAKLGFMNFFRFIDPWVPRGRPCEVLMGILMGGWQKIVFWQWNLVGVCCNHLVVAAELHFHSSFQGCPTCHYWSHMARWPDGQKWPFMAIWPSGSLLSAGEECLMPTIRHMLSVLRK